MIYESKDGAIDLQKITRLYPAVDIDLDGDRAEMSLEWMDMNEGKVSIESYILVFDFTLPKAEQKDRKVLKFESRDELVLAMSEVARLI